MCKITKDKLILVVYVNIGDVNMGNTPETLNEIMTNLRKQCDETVELLCVPIRHKDTYIEAINPKRLSDEEIDDIEEKVQNFKKVLEESIENIKKNNV